jgi:hypothetical protein
VSIIQHKPAAEIAKPGDIVTFVCGPGESPLPEFSYRKGKAYGVIRSKFGDMLRVKLDDFTFEMVTTFSTIGIGAYHFPAKQRGAA